MTIGNMAISRSPLSAPQQRLSGGKKVPKKRRVTAQNNEASAPEAR